MALDRLEYIHRGAAESLRFEKPMSLESEELGVRRTDMKQKRSKYNLQKVNYAHFSSFGLLGLVLWCLTGCEENRYRPRISISVYSLGSEVKALDGMATEGLRQDRDR